jgi:hypothetical protein
MSQAEEAPWNFHRPDEPVIATPAYHDVTVTVLDSWMKKFWRADGFINRMLDSLGALGGKVRSMPERGPDDYAETSYQRGVRDGARHAAPRNFGGVNGNGWATWVLGIVGVLIAASVLGLTSAMFTMSQKVASLEAKVDIILAGRK